MKRIWKAKISCCMPDHDYAVGEKVELDDEQVTDRVRALFTCMTPDEIADDAKKEVDSHDMTFKVKMQRLKQMNITIPRGANKETIDRLFDEHCVEAVVPTVI